MKKKVTVSGGTPFDFVVYCADAESAMLSAFGKVNKLDRGRCVVTCKSEVERDRAMDAVSKWKFGVTQMLIRPEGEQ